MPRPADTTEEAWNIQLELLRAMSPSQRVQSAIELSEVAAAISEAGAKRRRLAAS